MSSIYPKEITNLPEADLPFEGVKAYISQGENSQVVFMEFEKDVEVPNHSHNAQLEIVLSGKADVVIDGDRKTYVKGDRFYIQNNEEHSAFVYAGYAAVAFFNEKQRYKMKK